MGIGFDGSLRRWDHAATVLSRLKTVGVFGELLGPGKDASTRAFERRVTLGFKLLSGFFSGKIAKNDLERLPTAVDDAKQPIAIPWGSTTLETSINDALSVAWAQDHFRYWDQWGLSLIDLTSDAVALDFVLVLTKDWVRKSRPITSSAALRAYRKNARVLLDRLIYEYCTGRWRGSSDSRIADSIRVLTLATDANFQPIPQTDWETLIDEIVNEGKIDDVSYLDGVDRRIELLLNYRNVVARRWPPAGAVGRPHIDHIIPSAQLAQVQDVSVRSLEHHIKNLAPLPEGVNRAKSDKFLNQIASDADKQIVAALEDVPLTEFDRYSKPEAVTDLGQLQGPLLRRDLTEVRHSMVNG